MFLTLEDPNARIQGSRDPLGVQPLWAAFGRHVVTNLSTVSTSVRGFTAVLLARFLTERMMEKGMVGEEDALPIFLRMEQIAAYARHVGHGVEGDIRGIERVKRSVEQGGSAVPIQDDATGMILSDQQVYGLWGLYSVSARVSGLIADGPAGLTDFARAFAEKHYWPKLQPTETRLSRLLKEGGTLRLSERDPVFRAAKSVLPNAFTAAERGFYGDTLRDACRVRGSPGALRQKLFADLLREHADLDDWTGRAEVLELAKQAQGDDATLSDRLRRIARLEALLAPAEALFEYLQTRGGQTPGSVASTLHQQWGGRVPHLDGMPFTEILPDVVAAVGRESNMARVIAGCDSALAAGGYEQAVLALLDWNKLVMAGRKAAPWVKLASGKIDVRYRGRERAFPAKDELPGLWRNSYFIDALKSVVRQLELGR